MPWNRRLEAGLTEVKVQSQGSPSMTASLNLQDHLYNIEKMASEVENEGKRN